MTSYISDDISPTFGRTTETTSSKMRRADRQCWQPAKKVQPAGMHGNRPRDCFSAYSCRLSTDLIAATLNSVRVTAICARHGKTWNASKAEGYCLSVTLMAKKHSSKQASGFADRKLCLCCRQVGNILKLPHASMHLFDISKLI